MRSFAALAALVELADDDRRQPGRQDPHLGVPTDALSRRKMPGAAGAERRLVLLLTTT
jgi:hypothetical protein